MHHEQPQPRSGSEPQPRSASVEPQLFDLAVEGLEDSKREDVKGGGLMGTWIPAVSSVRTSKRDF